MQIIGWIKDKLMREQLCCLVNPHRCMHCNAVITGCPEHFPQYYRVNVCKKCLEGR